MKPTPPLVTAAGLVVAAVLFAFGFWWADTRLTLATPHVALGRVCVRCWRWEARSNNGPTR
jgi:hypothetical protein